MTASEPYDQYHARDKYTKGIHKFKEFPNKYAKKSTRYATLAVQGGCNDNGGIAWCLGSAGAKLPISHGRHSVLPGDGAKYPTGHGVQKAFPWSAVKCPIGHSAYTWLPSDWLRLRLWLRTRGKVGPPRIYLLIG